MFTLDPVFAPGEIIRFISMYLSLSHPFPLVEASIRRAAYSVPGSFLFCVCVSLYNHFNDIAMIKNF
jgi:hypothetical protein